MKAHVAAAVGLVVGVCDAAGPVVRALAAGGLVLASAGVRSADATPELFNTRFCFACHSVQHDEVKKMGPYMVDVAAKYGSRSDAPAYLVGRVLGGSQGVWGDPKVSAMPPNKVTEDEAKQLVAWLLQQK